MEEMNNMILELFEKIEWLEKLYNQTLVYVNFSINQFWLVLFGIISLAGVGLVFLAKQMTQSGIEKGIRDIKLEFDERFRKQQALINDNIKNNEYESGTWTPKLNVEGFNYGNQSGKYYKMGDLVIVWLNMTIDDFSKGSSNNFLGITGLPFVPNTEEWCDLIISIASEKAVIYKGHIKPMTTTVYIKEITQNNLHTPIYDSNFSLGTEIKGTLIYKI